GERRVAVTGKINALYRNLPIRLKILTVLYLLITVPLIVVGATSYNIASSVIEKKTVEYSHDMLSMINYRLAGLLVGLESLSNDVLSTENVYRAVARRSFSSDKILAYEQHESVVGYLEKLLIAREELRSVCIVCFNGMSFFADNNKDKQSIMEQVDIVDMLVRARETKGRPIIYIQNKPQGDSYVYLLRMIINRDEFTEAGFLIFNIDKRYLTSAFSNLQSQYLKNLAVVTDDNNVVFSSSEEAAKTFKKLTYSDNQSGYDIDKANNLLKTYVTVPSTNWRIVSYIPLPTLYLEVNELRNRIIILCGITFFCISLLGWLAARDIIKPVNALVKGMKRLQGGQVDVSVPIDRQDELGYLTEVFNKMVQDIQHLMNSIYREQITRKEAELKALQSQMNPHFLFNTLESINWMAQMQNVPEISETVSNLSSLIEAGIGRDARLITVSEEFAYIEQYVAIIKRRLEDRLEFSMDVENDILNVPIPRLLIQPIIENSVYHGIERVRRKGVIVLKAFSQEDKLVITVYDNGAGIPKEELENFRNRLAMDDDAYFKMIGKKGKSVGIENVNRRIKLFYGQSYGLQIESEEGSFTRITVTIPLLIRKDMEGFYVQGHDS
ncbi:MAG: sensor histidine kinase, partial [Clostridia bacterium]|nr:sensor histidine kinase [Clostridia bacterium]